MVVLCYHAISDTWPHALAVSPRAFARQLRSLLARGFRPASADGEVDGGGRVLHVTFDDAFASVERVMPLLARHSMPCTVFACPDFADTGRTFAVPELAADARSHPHDLETLDWDGLRRLAARGVEIGSHTLTHPRLPELDDAELERELRASRERIEAELQRPCRFLSYPYGAEDPRVREAARAAGYESAFGLPGVVRPADPFSLPRVGIYRKDGLLRATLKTSFVRHLVRRS